MCVSGVRVGVDNESEVVVGRKEGDAEGASLACGRGVVVR